MSADQSYLGYTRDHLTTYGAQQREAADLRARQHVAMALGLGIDSRASFAWEYLTSSIEECLKALDGASELTDAQLSRAYLRANNHTAGLKAVAALARQPVSEGLTPTCWIDPIELRELENGTVAMVVPIEGDAQRIPLYRAALAAVPPAKAEGLTTEQFAVIEECAQVLESAAKFNRELGRTVFANVQQDRAERLRAILAQQAKGATK